MNLADLPTLNAALNALAATLLVAGRFAIGGGERTRDPAARKLHARLMVGAFAVSVAFLVSYLIYHYHHPTTRYRGTGAVRILYLTILVTHIVLAVTVPPLALRTLYLAARGRFEKHRFWARLTFPIWLYVSVTGVIVYFMLYVFPPEA